jgi:probable HAF family extracellular repeat protein
MALVLAGGHAVLRSAPRPALVLASIDATDLGALGGGTSFANDINDRGEAAGGSTPPGGLPHAAVFRGGVVTDVGLWRPGAASVANAINDAGTVVGTFTERDGPTRAFAWIAGWMIELGRTTTPEDFLCTRRTFALDVNDADVIVGFYMDGSHPPEVTCVTGSRMAIWSGPTARLTTLAASGSLADASKIANDGTIVGQSNGSGVPFQRAVRRRAGMWTAVPLPPTVSAASVGHTMASGVNAHGHVVGRIDLVTATGTLIGTLGYVWNGVSAAAIDLTAATGGLLDAPTDINDAGFIAANGKLTPSSAVLRVGYVYHPALGARLLPAPPGAADARCGARAINQWDPATGLVQLAGSCSWAGRTRAVRWDVVAVRPPPRPTP